MNDEIAEKAGQSRPGAPQVLEIPPTQDAEAPSAAVPPVDTPLREREPIRGSEDLGDERTTRQELPSSSSPTGRPYLGLVYISTEMENGGVEVLDVLVGSPAARAGFVGSRTPVPDSRTDQLMKVAVVGLMMSPVGFAVIPLMLAHEMFLSCHPRGDVILAVGDQAIRNALELNDEIRRYHPGEQVVFSVVRCKKQMQITAQIEEEASDFSDEATAKEQPR
jgi:S1-C subfamily serine protease